MNLRYGKNKTVYDTAVGQVNKKKTKTLNLIYSATLLLNKGIREKLLNISGVITLFTSNVKDL